MNNEVSQRMELLESKIKDEVLLSEKYRDVFEKKLDILYEGQEKLNNSIEKIERFLNENNSITVVNGTKKTITPNQAIKEVWERMVAIEKATDVFLKTNQIHMAFATLWKKHKVFLIVMILTMVAPILLIVFLTIEDKNFMVNLISRTIK